MPPTTPRSSSGVRGWSGRPKRSEFRLAMGRAPIVKTSRRMPPTPVAAPWCGSMKLGWLCDSILKTAAVRAARLVRAVLAPHDAEDAELGVGRLAAERSQDAAVLLVGELVLLDEGGRDRRVVWHGRSRQREP